MPFSARRLKKRIFDVNIVVKKKKQIECGLALIVLLSTTISVRLKFVLDLLGLLSPSSKTRRKPVRRKWPGKILF